MAQVCGGSSFDFLAERRHQVAERILTRTADLCATQASGKPAADSIIAVLLRVYLGPLNRLETEARTLEQWLTVVGAPQDEIVAWAPHISASARVQAFNQLKMELSYAAEQWSLGDPEQPPVDHALSAIEHTLFSNRLIHWAPKSKIKTLSKSK